MNKGGNNMEQQVNYTEKPRGSTGGKVFLILEMIVMIAVEILRFVASLFPTDAASSIPLTKVLFWVVFFAYLTGYILLIIATSNRNNIGLLITGFVIFMLLEWESFFTSFTNPEGFITKLIRLNFWSQTILYSFTFVWVSMIILACIKKAPKPLCLLPGLIAVAASVILLISRLTEMSLWSSLSTSMDGKEIAYIIFNRIASIVYILVILFRPFWIFMVAHWMTHPTIRVALRPVAPRVVSQPVQGYGVPIQPYQQIPQPQSQPVYQPVPQGYQQIPQQGYPQYGQPQQFPPQQ